MTDSCKEDLDVYLRMPSGHDQGAAAHSAGLIDAAGGRGPQGIIQRSLVKGCQDTGESVVVAHQESPDGKDRLQACIPQYWGYRSFRGTARSQSDSQPAKLHRAVDRVVSPPGCPGGSPAREFVHVPIRGQSSPSDAKKPLRADLEGALTMPVLPPDSWRVEDQCDSECSQDHGKILLSCGVNEPDRIVFSIPVSKITAASL